MAWEKKIKTVLTATAICKSCNRTVLLFHAAGSSMEASVPH